MDRLTAFEFIAATDAPQLVRVKNNGVVVAEFGVTGWLGLSLGEGLPFNDRADLVIEGQGLGRPYWDGDPPAWTVRFDGEAERARIATIRAAVQREINRASLALM